MRGLAAVILLTTAACVSTPTSTSASDASVTPSASEWIEIAPMNVARSEHPGVVLDGELIVAGGFIEVGVGRTGVTATVEAYDPDTGAWHDLPALPVPVHHGMAASVSDRLFFIGGYSEAGDPIGNVWELVGDDWVDRASLPRPLAAGAAVAMDNQIYVVGGTPHGGVARYDLAQDSWSEGPDPGLQREHVAAVAYEGEIWLIAGRWQGEIFDSTEVFDPLSGSWRAGSALNESRSGFGAAVIDGAIVVAGGEVFGPDQALSTVERLEVDSDQWSLIDPVPHGIHGNPLLALGPHLYLPGGSTRAGGIENDGRVYRIIPD